MTRKCITITVDGHPVRVQLARRGAQLTERDVNAICRMACCLLRYAVPVDRVRYAKGPNV